MHKQLLFLIIVLLSSLSTLYSQDTIWIEGFEVPEKGYWGGGSDLTEITKWSLNVDNCNFVDEGDYVKTVTTNGGRMQNVQSGGEAVWSSEVIDITGIRNIDLLVDLSETGTSTNIEKYANVFYILDGGSETPFANNSSNIGNFGSVTATQSIANGSSVQVVIRINNPLSSNAVIFDNVRVLSDMSPPKITNLAITNINEIKLNFSEELEQVIAENPLNYQISGIEQATSATLSFDQKSVDLFFTTNFESNESYSVSVSNIEDLKTNIMTDTIIDFVFVPFEIEQLFVLSKNELLLEFSHDLNELSAENPLNYIVNQGIGNPLIAEMVDDTIVKLIFEDFSIDNDYLLSLTNIEDKNGFPLGVIEVNFGYYPGNTFDLIVSELMVDVSPSPGVLPATKYIELYNRSQVNLDLSGWKLQVGDNAFKDFENYILQAGSYLIICALGDEETLKSFGNTMGILSQSQLTGSGTSVILYNKEDLLVEYVNYSDSWYKDESKNEGGWSLERIDVENFCGAENNWQASEDYKGGTPGKENSVVAENSDNIPFELLQVKILSSTKLALAFSKNVTETTALNTTNYQLDDGANTVLFTQFSDTSRTAVILQFQNNFTDAQEQEIHVKGLEDFCGNTISNTIGTFTYYLISAKEAFADSEKFIRILFSEEVDINTAQIAVNYKVSDGVGSPMAAYKHSERKNEVFLEFPVEFSNERNYVLSIENVTDLNGNPIKPTELIFTYFVPSNNDVVINELLFNPRPEGVDFVEIYNIATKPVDLSKMSLARRNDEGEIESIKQLSEFNEMLQPSVFLAVSADTIKTKLDYPAASFDQFLQIPVMPAFNDDEGAVVLLYNDSVVDEFNYNEKMHFALIADAEGVSLERIDPLKSTENPNNWHSTASTVGFATPANQNSQFRQLADGVGDEIVIEPETFSPDNDGYEDVVFIRYKFNEPGYVANVSIYDAKGRLVKRIANIELLAAKGEFCWDGLYENQTKARIGIYVIYFEIFNLQGVVKKTKKTCVLAGKLN